MNVWDRVAVRYCCTVEGTVVTTRTPVSRSLLWYQVERRRPGARRGTNDSQLEHVLEFFLSSLKMIWCEMSGTSRDWWTCCLYVMSDVMLDRCIRRGDVGEDSDSRLR